LLSAPGVAAWGVLVVSPLVVLYAFPDVSAPTSAPGLALGAMTLKSFLLAAALAGVAVLLGWVPGRLLGTARRGRSVLLGLLLLPLLLPRYVLYYAWALLLSPTTALGAYLADRPPAAQAAGAATSAAVLVLWYWPLAALLLAQGWRGLDADVLSSAHLEAKPAGRFRHVLWPLLRRPAALAFAVCFVLCLSEFGTFHLAGVRTLGTELAVLYEWTGSSSAVARAAWPMVLASAAAALLLWREAADWSTRVPTGPPRFRQGWLRWAMLAVLAGLSLAAPLGLLVAGVTGGGAFGQFLAVHCEELAVSALTAVVGSAGAMWMAASALGLRRAGRAGAALAVLMQVTILLAAFLPGSVIGVGLLRLACLAGLGTGPGGGWMLVSAALAARFAGLSLVGLAVVGDSASGRLGEMASVDGASWPRTWWHVHLPRSWAAAVGVGLAVVMFGMTELSATMVVLPAGAGTFAQRLVNQMHYLSEQQVIASCLVLVGAYLLLWGLLAVLLGLLRRASSAPVVACLVLLALAGCGSGDGEPKVRAAIGRTGRGRCEFIYPRAIAVAADDSFYVVDKTGRIQHLSRRGRWLGEFRMPATAAGKPTGLTVGPDGNLYVADTHYHRVVVFSPAGELLRTIGRFGTGPGRFIFPTDVAFGPDGRMYVSEYGGNDRVSIFSPGGRFLASFGSPGSGPGQFSRPAALAVDGRRGRLYVADAANHRIVIYTLTGRLLGSMGSPGAGRGRLRYPYDLALRRRGELLVCEYGNNRLQLFSPAGESLGTWGGPGRRLGRLACPWGVAIDSRGRAIIVDGGNNRLQVWDF